jgi:hypothetical protein
MTWHTHLKTTQSKKLTQSNKKKKNPHKLKLTLNLNYNSLPLSPISPLKLEIISCATDSIRSSAEILSLETVS